MQNASDGHQIDFDFISSLEGGNILQAYVPDPKNSKSGVTLAVGFDIGARNEHDLRELGLPPELISQLSPYLGLQGMDAKRYLDQHPFSISSEHAITINKSVKAAMIARVVNDYNEASESKFASLSARWQTVIASVSFQYGSLPKRCPSFWRCVINQDWHGAIVELRDFGDRYPSRRNKEADYVEHA
ncbi:pesticin C-terminus-like muramidase [Ningiella sp. W23]|uniref:pesticin C-terminus-like muramidase n=1 Tax=Ningiella sp. W23 TaxID=3023715 RepID=UPI003757EF87